MNLMHNCFSPNFSTSVNVIGLAPIIFGMGKADNYHTYQGNGEERYRHHMLFLISLLSHLHNKYIIVKTYSSIHLILYLMLLFQPSIDTQYSL